MSLLLLFPDLGVPAPTTATTIGKKIIFNPFTNNLDYILNVDDILDAILKSTSTRITTNTSLASTYNEVFCDTDGGALTVTLPAGVIGRHYRIINCGSGGNDVTVTPATGEQIKGAGADVSQTISDGEVMILTFETTEEWW